MEIACMTLRETCANKKIIKLKLCHKFTITQNLTNKENKNSGWQQKYSKKSVYCSHKNYSAPDPPDQK